MKRKVNRQGVQFSRYAVIPRTLIFIRRNNQVLLLRGAPDKRLWPDLYNGIGGHIEKGEDVLSSARRELYEETGLTVEDLWLCGTIMIDTGEKTGICVFVFQGDYQSGQLIESEEGTPGWFDRSQLSQLSLVEDLSVLLPKVMMMKKGDLPFLASYSYDHEGNLQISFAQ